MLTRFEPELIRWLMEKFAEIGVEVRTGTAVEAIEQVDSGLCVHGHKGSEEIVIEADLVVHAAGRVPDLDLNLSAAGIAVENGRVALDEFLQSVSNPAVYAAGDAAAKGPPLTPVSSHDGKVIAANLLESAQLVPLRELPTRQVELLRRGPEDPAALSPDHQQLKISTCHTRIFARNSK